MSTEPATTDTAATPEWDEVAAREEEHALNIAKTENDLRAAVTQAANALSKVGNLLHSLTEGQDWHVEYAEGIAGRDAKREIQQAEQSLRNVQRIVHELSGKGDQ